MLKHELRTQIFYLNRIFEILSDGYMLSIISFNWTTLKGTDNLPFSTISDEKKINLQVEELEGVLDKIFIELYNHAKRFTSAPKIFAQDWNNDFVLMSIEETKNNILEYSMKKEIIIKATHDFDNDGYIVIEFVYENEKRKEVIFFETHVH